MAISNLVMLSNLEGANRMDAEYYHPEYVVERRRLRQADVIRLKTAAFITDGQHGYHIVDPSSEIRHITAKCVLEGLVTDDGADRLSVVTHNKNLRSALTPEDVLITTAGSIGECGIVTNSILPANIDQDVARIHIRNRELLSPYYLLGFLLSKYGQLQIRFNITGQDRQHLAIEKIHEIYVPVLSVASAVEELVKDSIGLRLSSVELYDKGEDLLLEELGLEDFYPKHELSYTASLSKAFNVHRVDAEYFQPAYNEVTDKVISYKNGYTTLLSSTEPVRPDFDPGRYLGSSFRYVELADIDTSVGIIRSASEIRCEEAPSRARRILKRGDVIASSVEGSLEKVALVDEEYEGSLASTGFFQFRSRGTQPEVLLTLSKSAVLQAQLKRECAGTILTAVPNDSLKRIIIPLLPPEIQERIAELIRQSHEARRKARDLLEEAKRKVEEAIETISAK